MRPCSCKPLPVLSLCSCFCFACVSASASFSPSARPFCHDPPPLSTPPLPTPLLLTPHSHSNQISSLSTRTLFLRRNTIPRIPNLPTVSNQTIKPPLSPGRTVELPPPPTLGRVSSRIHGHGTQISTFAKAWVGSVASATPSGQDDGARGFRSLGLCDTGAGLRISGDEPWGRWSVWE